MDSSGLSAPALCDPAVQRTYCDLSVPALCDPASLTVNDGGGVQSEVADPLVVDISAVAYGDPAKPIDPVRPMTFQT